MVPGMTHFLVGAFVLFVLACVIALREAWHNLEQAYEDHGRHD